MTTQKAAVLYELDHILSMSGKSYALYNPHDQPLNALPIIYGFNNGGEAGWMQAILIAQDGTELGGHICSAENYMLHDLGILEGTRLDRHERFRKHYPGGYRMKFVGYEVVKNHVGLQKALKLHATKRAVEENNEN